MLKEKLKVIALALLVVVLVMLGSATKLEIARNIKLEGAVSGNADFDGDTNIIINTTQNNIAVITGTITMPEAGSSILNGTENVSYPTGFTNENCVVISLMSYNINNTNCWSTRSNNDAMGAVLGSGDLRATLTPSEIHVNSTKASVDESRKDVTFKLVLMKI